MHFNKPILLVLIALAPLACTQTNSGSSNPNARTNIYCPAGSKANAAGTDCVKTNAANGGTNTNDGDLFDDFTDEGSIIPDYNSAELDARFNRRNLATIDLPEEYEEARIIAKRTEFHRRIFWDLRVEHWSAVNPRDYIPDLCEYRANCEREEQPVQKEENDFVTADQTKLSNISTHQPLQVPTLLPFDDEPIQFYLAGHAKENALAEPCDGTLVLSPSPYPANNEKALAPPIDYEQIYLRQGRTLKEEFAQCYENIQKLVTGEIVLPPIEQQTKCDLMFQGVVLAEVNGEFIGGSYNPQSQTGNNAFEALIQKESVAIWRPQPKEGYKCLGDVTTNGKNSKPFNERDHFNNSPGILDSANATGQQDRYAMYCIKEELLVRGKIDPASMISDGTVTIFEITKDEENAPDGYAFGNFFYSMKGPAPASKAAMDELVEKTEVWVLDRTKTVFVDDDVRSIRPEGCPARS